MGSHLIANMLQQAFFFNIEACTENLLDLSEDERTQQRTVVTGKPITFSGPKGTLGSLVREGSRVGSITKWEPTIRKTDLRIANFDKFLKQFQVATTGKQLPTRTDRKNKFILPLCNASKLSLVLEEPHLKGIGMRLENRVGIGIQINDKWMSLHAKVAPLIVSFVTWVKVPPSLKPRNGTYTVSFCRKTESIDPGLGVIFGFMHPGTL